MTPSGIVFLIGQVVLVGCLLVVGRWIYRLTLHPLAKVPGPKLAAISSAYAMSWDLPHASSYIRNFAQWHEKYGPMIRIEPNHVHILDIESYNKVFKIGTKFYRDPTIYSLPFTKGGFFNKLHVKDAKPHRDLYMSYFSRSNVQSLEPAIREHLTIFLHKLDEAADGDRGVDLTRGFRCLVADTVMRYSYDKPYGALNAPNFEFQMLENIEDFFDFSTSGWYFPNFMGGVVDICQKVPRPWIKGNPPIASALENLDGCEARMVELKKEEINHQSPSIFQTALDPNPTKGHPILSTKELAADALTIFTAGTDTTASALVCGTWRLMQQPATLKRLQDELDAAIPHSDELSTMPLDWPALESLPYLRAVIRETLRLSYGVPGKLPRVVPPGGAELAGTFLPGGTTVSMACYVYHHHEPFFERPDEFLPERWLDPEKATELERAWIPFSRGSRNCIGQNLAWSELFYTFAYLFRRFEISNGGTTERDMEWHDAFVVATFGHLRVRLRRK
jgi:cytochrome P450